MSLPAMPFVHNSLRQEGESQLQHAADDQPDEQLPEQLLVVLQVAPQEGGRIAHALLALLRVEFVRGLQSHKDALGLPSVATGRPGAAKASSSTFSR